jgi:hypothetical protein
MELEDGSILRSPPEGCLHIGNVHRSQREWREPLSSALTFPDPSGYSFFRTSRPDPLLNPPRAKTRGGFTVRIKIYC